MSCVFTGVYRNDPRGPHSDGQAEPKNAGPDGWRFLHLSALDGKLTQELAQQFGACIQCPDCHRHFMQLLKDHPVASSAPAAAFAVTVAWHNSVNAKRHVPAMSVEKAKALWTGPRIKMVALGLAAPGVPQFSAVVAR